MKLAFLGLLSILLSVPAVYGKTRIAVSTFTDKTGDSSRCRLHWWGSRQLGEGFRDQIVTALLKEGRYEVVERENLKTMYHEEHELINANKKTLPKENQFRAAHYSITGAVTSFELCNGGIGGKADVGGLFGFKDAGLKLGASTQKAKVVIDLRIIDVETSEVTASFQSDGSASSTKIVAEGDIKGSQIGSDAFYSTPIGEATRDAINNAVSQIATNVPDKKDEAVAEAPKQQQEQPREQTLAQDSSRQTAAKAAPLKSSQIAVSHFCSYQHTVELAGVGYIHNAETFVDCKPLRLSETGKRVSVIYLNDAKEALIETSKVMNLEPLKAAPKVGQKVFTRAQGRFSVACKVIDTDGSNVVVICGKKEVTTTFASLFIGLPFKMPLAVSQR